MDTKKVEFKVTNVPLELLRAAQAQAAKEDISLSAKIRQLIRKWLEESK